MSRITFDSIFTIYPDGSIEPKKRIRVNGVELGPGVRFSKGVAFSGIDFALFIGKDLEVDENEGIVNITGIYQ